MFLVCKITLKILNLVKFSLTRVKSVNFDLILKVLNL